MTTISHGVVVFLVLCASVRLRCFVSFSAFSTLCFSLLLYIWVVSKHICASLGGQLEESLDSDERDAKGRHDDRVQADI